MSGIQLHMMFVVVVVIDVILVVVIAVDSQFIWIRSKIDNTRIMPIRKRKTIPILTLPYNTWIVRFNS